MNYSLYVVVSTVNFAAVMRFPGSRSNQDMPTLHGLFTTTLWSAQVREELLRINKGAVRLCITDTRVGK